MTELTRKQFDILELLVEGACSQRGIQEKTGMSPAQYRERPVT